MTRIVIDVDDGHVSQPRELASYYNEVVLPRIGKAIGAEGTLNVLGGCPVKMSVEVVPSAPPIDDERFAQNDPVNWVWFTLGRLAAAVNGKVWLEATGLAGRVVRQLINAASELAYLDREKETPR